MVSHEQTSINDTITRRGLREAISDYLERLQSEFFALGAQVRLGIKAGLYGFEAEVERKHLDNGIEREPPPGDPWERETKRMFGGFGDIGVSLGAGLKAGASNLLSEVSFRSFHNIPPNQFSQCSFYVIRASALTASGALLSATGASSAVMVMSVNTTGSAASSARMVAGVDSFMVPPDPSKPTSQLIKKNPVGFNAALFSLTLGWSWMTESEATIVRPPTAETEPEETLGRANRVFGAFFRKNSATLEGSNLSALEEALAVERAIFVSGGGHARAAGHASPEGRTTMVFLSAAPTT